MAAIGYTPIYLYYSSTSTNVPAAGNLGYGELALNITDKNLFFKDNTNTVNTVPIRQSSGSSNGWLSSTDWTTFNNKVSSQWVTSGSDIYYTTGNIGVGITNQASPLTVGGNPPVGGVIAAVGSSGSISLATSDNINSSLYIRNASGGSIIGTDGGGAIHIAAGGNTTSDRKLSVFSSGGVSIGDTTDPSAGNLRLGTGNLVIGTSGKGIDFSATAGTGTSELLADYEEGTWTGTLTAATPPTTPITATGKYTKIGRIVTVSITYNNVNTTGSSGNIQITGLPYAVNNAAPNYVGSCGYADITTAGTIFPYSSAAETTIYFYTQTGLGNVAISAGTGRYIWAQLTYFV